MLIWESTSYWFKISKLPQTVPTEQHLSSAYWRTQPTSGRGPNFSIQSMWAQLNFVPLHWQEASQDPFKDESSISSPLPKVLPLKWHFLSSRVSRCLQSKLLLLRNHKLNWNSRPRNCFTLSQLTSWHNTRRSFYQAHNRVLRNVSVSDCTLTRRNQILVGRNWNRLVLQN